MDFGSLVAWVAEADEPRGRAVALALSARGARVLVTGRNERAIAECVGEIAHAGGKARHFVGDAGSEAGVRACVDAAVARFTAVHVAVIGESAGTAVVASWPHELAAVRIVRVSAAQDETAAVASVLAQLAPLAAN
jgi:NAD(P)-dependent dehydrogenase (short-subunit alcohol dehydrogenase family)